MQLIASLSMYMVIPLVVGIYTVNYGRWAGRRGNGQGAWGLYVLAVLTVLMPFLVLLFRVPG